MMGLIRGLDVMRFHASSVRGATTGGTADSPQTPGTVKPDNMSASQKMVSLPVGHGSGCGHCTGMQGGLVPKEKLKGIIDAQYNKIMAHEQAHAAAAGGLGGGIVIEYGPNGIPVGGHVPIKMPALNSSDPDKAIRDAKIVQTAALAPGDPSSQDRAVHAMARGIESRAQALKQTKEQQAKSSSKQNPFAVNKSILPS